MPAAFRISEDMWGFSAITYLRSVRGAMTGSFLSHTPPVPSSPGERCIVSSMNRPGNAS